MLQSIVLIVHVFVGLMIIGLVLLQRGKGAEAGTGFGAGASGTVFGARGSASFLSRATAALATAFFLSSLTLAFFANQQPAPESLLERSVVPAERGAAPPQATPAPGDELEGLPPLPPEPASREGLPQIEPEAETGGAGSQPEDGGQ